MLWPRFCPAVCATSLLVLVVLTAANPTFLDNDFQGLVITQPPPPFDERVTTGSGGSVYGYGEDYGNDADYMSSDYGTVVHPISFVKVSSHSDGFRFDVFNASPLVGFEFNIVSHPPNATIVATNGPRSVLAGFLLNYDVGIQKVVAWSPLEEAIEVLEEESEFYTLAYFETDTKGTYCIGQLLLVAPGVAKVNSHFQTSTANCTEVEV